jgi:hypothetical protein
MRTAFLVFFAFFKHQVAWGDFPRPEMRMWTDTFISKNYEATAEKNFNFIGARLQNSDNPDAQIKTDSRAGLAINAPMMSYINVSEIYFQNPGSRLSIGRKKSAWSGLDSRWNLGSWEPVFKWNPLVPERQGLTGFFLTSASQDWDIETMASPFYLPDQGPSFSVNSDGQFERGHAWFIMPAERIRLMKGAEPTQIKYEFNKPNETDVVLQMTLSARARYHRDSFSMQGSYAYKPMNQLPLAYKGMNSMPEKRVSVDILTSVQYHELAGLDLNWQEGNAAFGLSFLHDRPRAKASFDDSSYTTPSFDEASLFSPYIDLKSKSGWNFKSSTLANKRRRRD